MICYGICVGVCTCEFVPSRTKNRTHLIFISLRGCATATTNDSHFCHWLTCAETGERFRKGTHHPPTQCCCSEKERLLHSLEAFHVVYNLYGNSHMSVIMQKHSWQFLGAATEDELLKGTGDGEGVVEGEFSRKITFLKLRNLRKTHIVMIF